MTDGVHRMLTQRPADIAALDFTPAGDAIGIVDRKSRFTLVRVSDGIELDAIDIPAVWLRSMRFAPSGLRFACGLDDGTVHLCDLASRSSLTLRGHDRVVGDVRFVRDGALLASTSRDGTLRLWDSRSGAQRWAVQAHEEEINALDVSAGGEEILTGGEDGALRIWSTESGALLREAHPTDFIFGAAISPSGARVGCVGSGAVLMIFDAATMAERVRLELYANYVVGMHDVGLLASAPDGTFFTAGDGHVAVIDAESGAALGDVDTNGGTPVAISKDGASFASAVGGRVFVGPWSARRPAVPRG